MSVRCNSNDKFMTNVLGPQVILDFLVGIKGIDAFRQAMTWNTIFKLRQLCARGLILRGNRDER